MILPMLEGYTEPVLSCKGVFYWPKMGITNLECRRPIASTRNFQRPSMALCLAQAQGLVTLPRSCHELKVVCATCINNVNTRTTFCCLFQSDSGTLLNSISTDSVKKHLI
ncbi:hypothetical protein O6H91_15G067600 [Diphasiastrum complanatum]|uniref:Uncharacterized protein n=1 Tax=Diphasiastrum complanatum TaxID=34168 RepID=A0ACC2BJ73_DIPCM|nr:hypothetical protein O6H91_15G067600 [Diphasiastrum complanatum]